VEGRSRIRLAEGVLVGPRRDWRGPWSSLDETDTRRRHAHDRAQADDLRNQGQRAGGEHVRDPSPILRLAGPWLEEAGFPIGAEVAVEVVEPGSLLVTRVKGEAEAGELLLPLVWISAEQLGRLERARAEAGADG
jgi:Toxin SymE, type I toxin-antitoxin system